MTRSDHHLVMLFASTLFVLSATLACESKPSDAAPPTKDETKVVTSAFSDVKTTVRITVPKGYGYCATPGCGRIEGPVPDDACSNNSRVHDCRLNLVAERPEDFLPAYMIKSSSMPANGDTFNYSLTGATWTCKRRECTAVEDNRKNSTLDVARAIALDDGRAIIVSGRMMLVTASAAPKMRKVMESVLKTATVTALKP